MKSDLLKALALKAKNRLINKNNKESQTIKTVKIVSENDKDFYDKVKTLLQSDDYSLSPMKFLMDENKLMKLDAIGRERYLLETIDKYNKVKKLIDKENTAVQLCFNNLNKSFNQFIFVTMQYDKSLQDVLNVKAYINRHILNIKKFLLSSF